MQQLAVHRCTAQCGHLLQSLAKNLEVCIYYLIDRGAVLLCIPLVGISKLAFQSNSEHFYIAPIHMGMRVAIT